MHNEDVRKKPYGDLLAVTDDPQSLLVLLQHKTELGKLKKMRKQRQKEQEASWLIIDAGGSEMEHSQETAGS